MMEKTVRAFVLSLGFAGMFFRACAADAPHAWVETASTNMIVTQRGHATLYLRLPPLPEPYEKQPPILNQRAPHINAPFLEPEWQPKALTLEPPRRINPGAPRRGEHVRFFTLNKYVSNEDVFSAMRDPFGFFGDDPFAPLRPKAQYFPFVNARDEKGNWLFKVDLPVFTAKEPGKVLFEAAQLAVPVIAKVDAHGRATLENIKLATQPFTVGVSLPPVAGRPPSWCGAIGSTFEASAALDATVCTAGDPLLLSLTITGDAPVDTIMPPDTSHWPALSAFRLDAASLKTAVLENGKRFTWRVRAIEAGTCEFPALAVSWFDLGTRTYKTVRTQALPVQIKAGAQATLGAYEEQSDVFPMPDGLDLDFPRAGQADFTLERALVLATRASAPADFALAADAYEAYLSAQKSLPRALRARHLTNVAALRFMAQHTHRALAAYARAERLAGETPATLRGIRACWARLKNDPHADLPLQRVLFPFLYRYALNVRIALCAGFLLALGLLFWGVSKAGARLGVMVAAFGLLAQAQAQLFNFNLGRAGGAAEVKGALLLEPAEVVVGEPCDFIVTLDVKKGVAVEQLRVEGLPDAAGGAITYADAFEPLTDGPAPGKDRVLRRFALPARFHRPFRETLHARVTGMAVTRKQSRFGHSSFSTHFSVSLAPLALDVQPLPEAGRPAGYSGAVGRHFRLEQSFSPRRVRPGDLVTLTCRLVYDGYFPTNALPRFAPVSEAFKCYPLEEKSRKDGEIVWQRMMVAQMTAATNGPAASLSHYDLEKRQYATVRAAGPALVFVASEKASTRNTAVSVATPVTSASDAPGLDGAARATQRREVRFAPAKTSPVLFVLSPGMPYRTAAQKGAWLRVETSHGTGWMLP